MTMLRAAKVPNLKAVLSVSPWRTEIRAGSDARRAALEPGNDRRTARRELRGTKRGLLGESGKADADPAAIMFAAPLTRADAR
jgi:hypothetical protein